MSTSTLARPSRADVRERILVAADKVFTAQGYANANLSQIAAEAGFTKGAVYSNFDSKPELFADSRRIPGTREARRDDRRRLCPSLQVTN